MRHKRKHADKLDYQNLKLLFYKIYCQKNLTNCVKCLQNVSDKRLVSSVYKEFSKKKIIKGKQLAKNVAKNLNKNFIKDPLQN